jgi:heptosyltransferase I
MRIAILKISAFGDIVNSMFILQFIKRYYPTSKIDWIVEKRFKGILENNPHIHKIHTINLNKAKKNKSIKLLYEELSRVKKFGEYDLVIDFQGLIKTAIIAKLIRSKKIIGFDFNSIRERLAVYFYDKRVSIAYDQNTIVRISKLASEALSINITKDDLFGKDACLFTESNLHLPEKPYIVFVIGSTWESRKYSKEKFAQVANEIKKKCIVIWGNEKEKNIANWIHSKSKYAQLAPKLEIDDLKRLIGNSSLLIGNDTGPSHMSWALNIPSIVLFGPTPIERMFLTNINKGIKSSSNINHFKLNKNDFSINEISVNEIVKIAKQLL